MKRVIIIPTYNEAANIAAVIDRLSVVDGEAYITVVDDNSPDGTAAIVRKVGEKNRRVSLISRPLKEGLGKAYISAFREVLADREVGAIAMMDADFSHNPDYVPVMFALLSRFDAVVGSRYVRGGRTVGWEVWRRLLSFFANLYCKILLHLPVFDATSGFYCLNADAVRRTDLSSIGVSGYAFQIQFKYLLWKGGARFKEFPIAFTNRVGGESKMSGHIVREGVIAPWKILFKKK